MGELTAAEIDRVYAVRARGGMRGQSLAPGSLARAHVVLRAALAQAMRWGWIWDNPAERAHRIVAINPELRPPTPDELRVLLKYLAEDNPKLHAFVTLAAFTGGRRAQLLGLRWRNLDLARGGVSFTGGWVEGPDGPVLAATKSKRPHLVELDPGTLDVLEAHARLCAEVSGGGLRPEGFVFSDDPDGVAAWKPNRVTKAFVRARRRAGLREFRLHDLRHFMATERLQAGVPIPVVSHRLDHQRVSTTLDFYAHAVPGGDAFAAKTLWQVVQRAG